MQVGIASRPLDGLHCGDQCAYWRRGEQIVLCLADGLGHGELAEAAAKAALAYVAQHLDESLETIFAGCDLALRRTRGAVMGIALVEPQMGTLSYAGVGNIRLAIIRAGDSRSGGQYRRLVSDYGIVGAGFCRLTCETLSLAPDDLVLLYSDGISESAPLGDCKSDDPQHLAQEILDTWGRNSDDVAVMIFKCGGAAW